MHNKEVNSNSSNKGGECSKKGPNPIVRMSDGSIGIVMRRKNGDVHLALIDEADYDKIKGHRWLLGGSCKKHPRNTMYCHASIRQEDGARRTVSLHTLLFGAPGVTIDHKAGSGLDCRRSAVRVAADCGNAQNRPKYKCNRSGYKGVSAHGPGWRAAITANRKHYGLGTWPTPEIAAGKYDTACIELHRDYAKPNFGSV